MEADDASRGTASETASVEDVLLSRVAADEDGDFRSGMVTDSLRRTRVERRRTNGGHEEDLWGRLNRGICGSDISKGIWESFRETLEYIELTTRRRDGYEMAEPQCSYIYVCLRGRHVLILILKLNCIITCLDCNEEALNS
jgi:hypothetical protein